MHRKKWKWKHNNTKSMGLSKNSAYREIHSNTSLPQETREKWKINNLTLYLKQLEKEEMKNLRVSRRKEIIKIRAGINKKRKKGDYSKNQKKLKAGSLGR